MTIARATGSSDDDQYLMNHAHRGLALIFNHRRFKESIPPEVVMHTEKDAARLHQTFSDLGFEVKQFDDLTKADLIKTLTDVSKEEHASRDCLVVAVLTHGPKSGVLSAYDEDYKVCELWNKFTPEDCPSLAAKPKLFFIQAYRGDPGADGPQDTFHVLPFLDLLVSTSIFHGGFWFPGHEDVSPYVHALCEQLQRQRTADGRSRSLLTLLTGVNRQLSRLVQVDSCPPQMPAFSSSLTRHLSLPARTHGVTKIPVVC